MKITRMRTNRMENPLGFYMDSARISYVAEESRGSRQTAARVVAAKEETFAELILIRGKGKILTASVMSCLSVRSPGRGIIGK